MISLNFLHEVHAVDVMIIPVLQGNKMKLRGAIHFLNPTVIKAPTLCQALG